MLRPARPLPRRFNRRVSPYTRAIVRKQRDQRSQYNRERLARLLQRLKRQFAMRRRIVVSVIAVLGALAVVASIAVILFSPLLTVQEVRVQRTDPRIDFEQVQNALSTVYGKRLFLLSPQEIEPSLREAIPDLAEVQIWKNYPSTIVLRLSFDPLLARLKIRDPDGTVVSELGSGATLGIDYLTTKGMYVLYTPSQVGSGGALPVLDVIDWGVRPSPWNILVDQETLTTMRRAEVALIDEFGQGVAGRTVFLRAREFHLELDRYSLWFDMSSELAEQLQRYRVFLETVGPQAASEYVDLRVKDKVMYR